MAQDGKVIAFSVDDGKMREVLTDPSGGSPTFGSWLDIFGIAGFTLKPEYLNKELKGDGTTLDIFSKLNKLTGEFSCQMSYEVMAILTGGQAAYTGSSPNTQATFTLSGNDLPKAFELDVQSLYKGGGDAAGGDSHVRVFKCKMTSFEYSFANEDYATVKIQWEASARLSDNKFGQFIENETVSTIAAGASDTTAPTVTGTSPADAATGVAANATVAWTFDEDIQFDAGNFSVNRVVSATDITNHVGSLAYDSTTHVVTYTPGSNYSSGANMVAVAQGVRDKAGNLLAAPSIVNFTIA